MANSSPVARNSRWRIAVTHGLPMAVQAAGSALGFLVVVVVSHRFGLEAQGRFGLLKSWSDAISVALMFGLPQALLHLSYHGGVPLARLRGYAQSYAGRLLMLVLPLAALAAFSPWPWLAWALVSATPLVFHGLLRSLMLRAGGPLAYACITACPALLLMLAVAVVAITGRDAFGPALLASALGSALVVWLVAQRAGIGSERTKRLTGVAAVNRHAFLQNLCAAAQSALLLSLIAGLDASPRAVGETSFALVFAQLFALAASFMAPLVYDAVAGADEPVRARAGLRSALRKLAVVLPALAIVAVIAVPPVVDLIFAAPYASATRACQLMALAGSLMLANRLGATVLQAQGAFAELSGQAVARLMSSLVFTVIALHWLQLPGALAVGAALLASEAILGARLWIALQRRLQPSASA